MGIHGLNQFLRKRCKMVFHKDIPLTKFAFKKIAVDISTYIYKYKSIFGDKWFRSFIHFIASLRNSKIHPIVIFDGPPLKEKSIEQKKRNKKKEDIKSNISKIKFDLNIYYQTGEVSELLKKCVNRRTTPDKIKRFLGKYAFNVKQVEEYVEYLSNQIIYIKQSEIAECQKILTLLGVPYYNAPNDAERLCVQLYENGEVFAVLSNDSDVIAYGVDRILSNINCKEETCTYINASEIVYHLDFKNKDELLDFCIMCGTDYNSNIKKMGPVSVYKLIKEYNTIDNFKLTIPFDYKHIRSLFKPPLIEKKAIYCKAKIDVKKIRKYLFSRRIYVDMNYIEKAFSPVKVKCL